MGLIINADDFGMFESANRGILYSLEKKLINSLSICVNFETTQNLTEILNYQNQLKSIGLHVNLTEGHSLLNGMQNPESLKLYNEGRSFEYYSKEIEAQILKFKNIYNFFPQHLDCHQHFVYLEENAFKAFTFLASMYDIPIRSTYIFSDKKKVERFFESVSKRWGIKVPFDIDKIVENMESIKVKERSKYLNLNCNDDIIEFEKKDLEIVCHPQISSTGEKNIDLRFLEKLV